MIDTHFTPKYYGDDPLLLTRITNTIRNLPADVAAFAIDRCAFVSVGRVAAGWTLPGRIGVHPSQRRSRNMWIIVLLESLPPEDANGAIAHEIAHAWLGHDMIVGLPEDGETQAASMVAEWGFTGIGSDPEYCNRPYQ